MVTENQRIIDTILKWCFFVLILLFFVCLWKAEWQNSVRVLLVAFGIALCAVINDHSAVFGFLSVVSFGALIVWAW